MFALCNVPFLWGVPELPTVLKVAALLLLVVCYLWLHIRPFGGRDLPGKLRLLGGSCELLIICAVCASAQAAAYIYLYMSPREIGVPVWIGGVVMAVLLIAALLANGLIRLFFASGQITLGQRVALIFLWWAPIANIVLFAVVYGKASREFKFGVLRQQRNESRRGKNVCATKYPLLLVHGIFFRDWKIFNYWGRVPEQLEANGSVIHYGNQHSSTSVEESAKELRGRIAEIVEKEGCEKVNIIAHSKGGLDSRYAISCLGMDEHVASLTTVNTPHRGCRFARHALDKIPQGLVSSISGKYDKIFAKLGDDQPDFFTGVSELSDEKCAELNELMPDREGVVYQSVGSRMKSASSASFPLNLGHGIVKAVDGENDGLVTVESMPWGEFTMLEPVGKRGISHGDVIDLTRKDVEGFDVCEFYIGLVSGLKERGL